MPRNYKRLQEKITFDDLMETLSEEFAQLPDHRRANSSYELADVLRSAFAMFSLKSPSLLAFKELTKQEEKNLKAIYRVQSVLSMRMAPKRTIANATPPNGFVRTCTNAILI
jgi:hypothetical protein